MAGVVDHVAVWDRAMHEQVHEDMGVDEATERLPVDLSITP